mmetsp:Transcript_15379/g.23392  ORF Transcript_15379/g.23392 Transcript_15379/m.23392 type:complete len:132 (-) Transcript_15379:1793-2188(-)
MSLYVSLGGVEMPLSYHWTGFILESPHRMFCHLCLNQCVKYETYNEEGISNWVERPMRCATWLLQQHVVVGGILFFIVFACLCLIHILEIIVLNHLSAVSSVFMVFVISRSRFGKTERELNCPYVSLQHES